MLFAFYLAALIFVCSPSFLFLSSFPLFYFTFFTFFISFFPISISIFIFISSLSFPLFLLFFLPFPFFCSLSSSSIPSSSAFQFCWPYWSSSRTSASRACPCVFRVPRLGLLFPLFSRASIASSLCFLSFEDDHFRHLTPWLRPLGRNVGLTINKIIAENTKYFSTSFTHLPCDAT